MSFLQSFLSFANTSNVLSMSITSSRSCNAPGRLPLPSRSVSTAATEIYHQVFDGSGKAVTLGEVLASGGEGSVYPLADRKQVLVKIYHPARLAKDGDKLRMKVEAAIALRQQSEVLRQLPLAWPQMSVFDEKGRWLGYAMRRAEGHSISVFRNPKLVRRDFPGLNRQQLVLALRGLVQSISALHCQQIFLGDINLDNFLLDQRTSTIWLIDCDSFQFSHNGVCYPCPVGQESMIPPEHQGKDLSRVKRTAQSDTFSLSVLIFMLLMSGRHPFEHVGGMGVTDNIRHGHFPYGQSLRPGSQGAIPLGPWYNWWSHLSYNLKSLFIETFTNGTHHPDRRISLSEFDRRLKEYEWSIKQGHLSEELWPGKAKPSKQLP